MKLFKFTAKPVEEQEGPTVRWKPIGARLDISVEDTKGAAEVSHIGFSKICRDGYNYTEIVFDDPHSNKPDTEIIKSILARLQYFNSFRSVTFRKSVHPQTLIKILIQTIKLNRRLKSVEILYLDIYKVSRSYLQNLIYLLDLCFSQKNARIVSLNPPNLYSETCSIDEYRIYSRLHLCYSGAAFPIYYIPKFRKVDTIFRLDNLISLGLWNFSRHSVIDHYCLHQISYLKYLQEISGSWKLGNSDNTKAVEYSVAKLIYSCFNLRHVNLGVPRTKNSTLLKAIFNSVEESFTILTKQSSRKWVSIPIKKKEKHNDYFETKLKKRFLRTRP
eukprot:snap_masked-scaffold_6-processed-gene-9.14-mRNA-1 protein AED:1.00 eAED:1.00 QI:0/0/0/0/1/1/2/0/330